MRKPFSFIVILTIGAGFNGCLPIAHKTTYYLAKGSACSICNGAGTYTCRTCNGIDWTNQSCLMCKGEERKRSSCGLCWGSGKRGSCHVCWGKAARGESCEKCVGSGYVERIVAAPRITTGHSSAENGSFYGELSATTGRPKTVFVNGYFRKDGTYIRSHYRSLPQGSIAIRGPPLLSDSFRFQPNVAETGSYYGEISKLTGRPKTVHVRGYYRKDGTYVRSHHRSKPRR